MFCNVSYFHFPQQHKEKFMWGSYFTFIFLFPRASSGPTDKTHSPLLYIVGKRRTLFSKMVDTYRAKNSNISKWIMFCTFKKISLKHNFFSFLQSTTPYPFLMKELPDIRHLYHLQSLWRKHLLNGEVSDLSYMTDVEKSKISLPPSCEISKFFTWQIWNNQVKSDFSP